MRQSHFYVKRELLWSFVILTTGITHSFHLFASFSGGDLVILGTYENQLYKNQNGYHYVNITYDSSNSVYLWKNRANRVYKLHPTAEQNELRVDESVGYYTSANWKIARIDNQGIYGPYDELYRKTDCFGKIYCFTL